MKIYSWNVLCYNKKFDEMCDFIRNLDFDVLCLQEVTPELLACLKTMPFHMVSHIDVIRLVTKENPELNYVAILSKKPIANSGTLQFLDFSFPFHTRLFIGIMRLSNWSFLTERGAVYADIDLGNGVLTRIFSVHLTLWGPHNRAKEFDAVIGHLQPGMPAIICGDFNIIEYGPMKILNWLLGAPLREATPWYPERDLFEERFAMAKLSNPLKGKVTHGFSRSQLDHILLTEGLHAKRAWVHPDLHGSDHNPVAIELEP
jgi:endonuclease/exonuclease/phosphatase family metal-dependent hydrolase